MGDPYRIPVIVGTGQISEFGSAAKSGPDVLDLMAGALGRAEQDSGGALLADVDFLGIENQTSSAVAAWPGGEPITPHLLARTGLAPHETLLTDEPSGDGPIYLLNVAANRIAEGKSTIVALVGAEALRTAQRRAAQGAPVDAQKQDAMRALLEQRVSPFLRKYGLLTPVDVYPLYESATRAAWGQSLAEAQAETALIWSGFSQVAAKNPYAWLRQALSADQISEVTPSNRLVTFPYTKLMVANNSVNQGAALLVTSLGTALERGIAKERLVFIGGGAAAHEDGNFLKRDSYTRSAAMAASISRALEINGLLPSALDMVELYSCFPCVVKMARREIGWPVERAASVYGGLTFGGGPIGNCMMHAVAMMTERLRQSGQHGLIFANGGFATHNHSIILSRTPPKEGVFPQDFDASRTASKLRGPMPVVDEAYIGPGKIEALSIPYRRDGAPAFATIVARAPDGRRFLARVGRDDQPALDYLVSGQTEPVGTTGFAEPRDDGLAHWRTDQ